MQMCMQQYILLNCSIPYHHDMAFVQWCFPPVMELCSREGQLPAEVNACVLWGWEALTPVMDSLGRNPIPELLGCYAETSRGAQPTDWKPWPPSRPQQQRAVPFRPCGLAWCFVRSVARHGVARHLAEEQNMPSCQRRVERASELASEQL